MAVKISWLNDVNQDNWGVQSDVGESRMHLVASVYALKCAGRFLVEELVGVKAFLTAVKSFAFRGRRPMNQIRNAAANRQSFERTRGKKFHSLIQPLIGQTDDQCIVKVAKMPGCNQVSIGCK